MTILQINAISVTVYRELFEAFNFHPHCKVDKFKTFLRTGNLLIREGTNICLGVWVNSRQDEIL